MTTTSYHEKQYYLVIFILVFNLISHNILFDAAKSGAHIDFDLNDCKLCGILDGLYWIIFGFIIYLNFL